MKDRTKMSVKYGMMFISLASALVLLSSAYAYESITNRESSVSVDVRPEQLADGQPAKFKVRMNTHSVNLSEDMVVVSVLKDNEGRIYKPIDWKGSPPGGHHRSGILEFPKLEGNPKTVTLIISDVSDVPQRVFQWNME